MQEALKATLLRFSRKAPDYELARTILGDDFIAPEEIAKSRGLTYSDTQIAEFGSTLPTQEVLEWCRDNGFMLMAGSPRAMSLLDIRELERDHFCSKEEGWYADSCEAFARNDKVETKWLILRKEPVPDSTRKNWGEQRALLSDVECVPNIAEQVWGLTTYKAVRGIYLLPSMCVRTSSAASDGSQVGVGGFDGDGLRLNGYNDHRYDHHLGVLSARKFVPRS